MIFESWEWKKELRERMRQFLRYNTKDNFDCDSEKTCFRLERSLLYSAFIIRFLIESEKLSNDADTFSINVTYYLPIKHINRLHCWIDDDKYDWGVPKIQTVLGKNICNWLIHSYMFNFLYEESGSVTGFFVASDYDRNRALYTVNLKDWLKFVEFVISDDVVSMTTKFDKKRSDYVITDKKRGARK
ncbi:MAG: hypothetical protein EOM51_07840 [Clostridia bacterium]|nr:hypothetical protein [Clostridia bacterium]